MLKNISKIIFNDKRVEALETGIYICPKCGEQMVWEDEEMGDLVCEHCGESMNIDRYGLSQEEIDDLDMAGVGVIEKPDEYDVIGGFNGFDGPFDQ